MYYWSHCSRLMHNEPPDPSLPVASGLDFCCFLTKTIPDPQCSRHLYVPPDLQYKWNQARFGCGHLSVQKGIVFLLLFILHGEKRRN